MKEGGRRANVREKDVRTESEFGVTQRSALKMKWTRAKECRQPLKAEKARKWILT